MATLTAFILQFTNRFPELMRKCMLHTEYKLNLRRVPELYSAAVITMWHSTSRTCLSNPMRVSLCLWVGVCALMNDFCRLIPNMFVFFTKVA